ncbi:uncharacterized protein [Haliotis asinina]|uniref:uncharacterized protein n=1 Tax=Haliotis asinina TaxID=109174 RepID=UPI00353199B8
MILQVIFIVVVLSQVGGHSDHWVYNVLYHQQQNLTCENEMFNPARMSTGTNLLWTLPSGKIIRPNGTHSRVDISPNGHWILVKHVHDEDFGVYNCLVFVQGNLTHSIRKGINIHGPYWGDLMKKYMPSVIVGVIAASVMFATLSFLCCWYDRHQGVGERLVEEYVEKMKEAINGGQVNAGFAVMEEIETKVPEKDGIELPPVTTRF